MYCRPLHLLSIVVLALVIALAACTPRTGSEPSAATEVLATVAAGPTAVPTTPTPLLTVRIMSYNILVGGGHDRELDQFMPGKWQGIDRTPMIVDYLKQLDADIIGLQEASGWAKGEPPFIKSVAEQLGMNYAIMEDHGWDTDVALLTKYPILESQDMTSLNSMLRAKLQGPDGNPINVYVVHLNSDSANDRSCGTQELMRVMQPYADQRTFLMGDMNFRIQDNGEWSPGALRSGGWQNIATDNTLRFDQIWAPGSLKWEATQWTTAVSKDISQMSDHTPVGRELMIYSPSGDELPPADDAASALSLPEMPADAAAALSNPRVTFMQQGDAPCNEQFWKDFGINASFQEGDLHLYGKRDWGSGASWSQANAADQGMLMDFKYEPKSEFILSMTTGAPDKPDFRKFGLYLGADEKFRTDLFKGSRSLSTEPWSGTLQPKPDTWYRMIVLPYEDGRLAAHVWQVDDTTAVASFVRAADPAWAGQAWTLIVGANKGAVDVRSVTQFSFTPVP